MFGASGGQKKALDSMENGATDGCDPPHSARNQSQSSTRATGTLNCRAVSPTPTVPFLTDNKT